MHIHRVTLLSQKPLATCTHCVFVIMSCTCTYHIMQTGLLVLSNAIATIYVYSYPIDERKQI